MATSSVVIGCLQSVVFPQEFAGILRLFGGKDCPIRGPNMPALFLDFALYKISEFD